MEGGCRVGTIREEMREGWKEIKRELMEMMRKQEDKLKEELDRMRREWAEKESKWEEMKREVMGRIEVLDKEVKRMREEREEGRRA